MLPQEDTTQEIRFQYLSTISQDDVNGLLYIRHVSQTAHGDCKLRIKLPRNIRISTDRHRQFRVEPPVYDHPAACPTSATCAGG